MSGCDSGLMNWCERLTDSGLIHYRAEESRRRKKIRIIKEAILFCHIFKRKFCAYHILWNKMYAVGHNRRDLMILCAFASTACRFRAVPVERCIFHCSAHVASQFSEVCHLKDNTGINLFV
jgi:hypothetical protein